MLSNRPVLATGIAHLYRVRKTGEFREEEPDKKRLTIMKAHSLICIIAFATLMASSLRAQSEENLPEFIRVTTCALSGVLAVVIVAGTIGCMALAGRHHGRCPHGCEYSREGSPHSPRNAHLAASLPQADSGWRMNNAQTVPGRGWFTYFRADGARAEFDERAML